MIPSSHVSASLFPSNFSTTTSTASQDQSSVTTDGGQIMTGKLHGLNSLIQCLSCSSRPTLL